MNKGTMAVCNYLGRLRDAVCCLLSAGAFRSLCSLMAEYEDEYSTNKYTMA